MSKDYIVGVSVKSFKFSDGVERLADYSSYNNIYPSEFKKKRFFSDSFAQLAYSAGDNLFNISALIPYSVIDSLGFHVFLDSINKNIPPSVDLLVEYYSGVFDPVFLFNRKEEVIIGDVFSYEILSYNREFLKVLINFKL